jgi:hypothetical protein
VASGVLQLVSEPGYRFSKIKDQFDTLAHIHRVCVCLSLLILCCYLCIVVFLSCEVSEFDTFICLCLL